MKYITKVDFIKKNKCFWNYKIVLIVKIGMKDTEVVDSTLPLIFERYKN